MRPFPARRCAARERRKALGPSAQALRASAGIAAAAALWTGAAWSQAAPDTSEWRCRLCPFDHGTQAEYTTGASYVSDDAARFADGNGYDRRGGYLLAEGSGRYAGDRQRLTWTIEDLGLDARRLTLTGNRAGALEYRVAYRGLPHYSFDSTSTVFARTASEQLTLPAGWVRAPVTSQMTSLAAGLRQQDIASQRDSFDLGVRLRPRDSLEVYADYQRQTRTGTIITGASFFNTTSQLPAPVDQSTDEVGLGVRYLGKHGTLDLGYRGSFFDNRLAALSWENPFSGPPGTERGRLAEAPDNTFHTVSLGGAFHFLERTAFTFSAGVGRGEQDETLLPYTSNSQLVASPLPRARLDGVVDTSHLALTVSSEPWERVRVRAAYRRDERDNRTPVSGWNGVIADTFGSATSESNIAYDFERDRFSLTAATDLSHRLQLSAGYERTSRNRNQQEVAGQTENGGWGRLKWRFRPGLELSARRGTSRRDIDRYDTSLAAELLQNPLLAKYNLAYRFRTFGDLTFTATGSERPFAFSLSAFYADDDYAHSRLGLTRDRDRRLATDFAWTFTSHVAFFASLGDERIDARQQGSESFAGPDWLAAHEDRFRTITAGLRLTQLPPRFDLTLDVGQSNGTTATGLASSLGSDGLPDLRSKLDTLRLRALYHRSTRLSVLIEVRYERLRAEDWALADVAPDTVASLLSLGAEPYRYSPVVLGAGVTYRWGAGEH
jgi:MtrB/PioB family decaheme-associated outer membrane protein